MIQIKKWTQNGKISSPNRVITLMDLFDVPVFEKSQMQGSINTGLSNGVQNSGPFMPKIIFMNHIRNR